MVIHRVIQIEITIELIIG